jgi:3-methyladenine DNA glycosylase Tag
VAEDKATHRAPWECTFAKDEGSRCLPGKKPRTDHEYFEILCLCILQAGLSWASVRRSWPRYRDAFLNFETAKLAHATPAALLRRPGALRNQRKVAALVANAREFERIREQHRTFARYLRTVKSDKDACAILQERFKHVGPYTAAFYLHCVGRSVYGPCYPGV